MKVRKFSTSIIVVLLFGIICISSSYADDGSCMEGKQAFEQFRYEDAVSQLGKCLEGGGLSKEQLVEVHKLLGFCYVAFDIRWQAKENFKKTLELDPSFDPTNDPVWGAKASEVFLEAKREHFAKYAAQLADQEKNKAIKAAFSALEGHRKENKFSPSTMKKLYQKFTIDFSGSKGSPYYLEVETWLAQFETEQIETREIEKFKTVAEPLIKKGKNERIAGIVLATAVPVMFVTWGAIQDTNQSNLHSEDDEDRSLEEHALMNQAISGYSIGIISLITGVTLCSVGHVHIKKGEAMMKGKAFLEKHQPQITLDFDKKARLRSLGIGFSW